VAVIFGVVLTLIGIGCAIMARYFFIGHRQFDDNGMGFLAVLFSAGAFLTLAIAAVLFIKAYMSERSKN
jgi:Na+-transporting NADH:ubiquinone oxidoreductase subunit NqrE